MYDKIIMWLIAAIVRAVKTAAQTALAAIGSSALLTEVAHKEAFLLKQHLELLELAVLLAYLVPALLLGLVVRRPVIHIGEWFERRLEDTRLM